MEGTPPDGVSVVGWRSLHALPSTSACCRRQAAARHERLAVASRSKMRQRSLGRRSRCLAFPVSNNQGNPLGRGNRRDLLDFTSMPAITCNTAVNRAPRGLLDGAPRRRPPPEHLADPRLHEVAAVQERCPPPVLVT